MPATQESHWEYTVREWTSPEFQNLLPDVSKLKVVYDIGANVGGFAGVLHRDNDQIKIYAFEPEEDNFNYLKENTNTISIQKGIYYGKKSAKAQGRGNNNVGGYFLEGIHDYGIDNGKVFELTTLEELDIEKPDLIKMDVEGAEKNIIENSTIVKNCPYLIIEWHFPEDATTFFNKHLPNHKVLKELESLQYLLCLK